MHVTTCDSPAHTPGLQGNVLVPLATRLRSRGAAGSPDGSCVGGTGLHGCPAKRALELLEYAERCGGAGQNKQSPAVLLLQPGLKYYMKNFKRSSARIAAYTLSTCASVGSRQSACRNMW
jgi:hypothetical protein